MTKFAGLWSGLSFDADWCSMPYQREAEIVLAMWREVERDLAVAEPDSDEAARLIGEAARLRDEHRRLVELAMEHHRPMPRDLDAEPDPGT